MNLSGFKNVSDSFMTHTILTYDNGHYLHQVLPEKWFVYNLFIFQDFKSINKNLDQNHGYENKMLFCVSAQ